ncbi:MAG TPA: ABC transporter permease, partial [Gemmatimonadaceae bacterium]|nr:ABC transporter permease [Gemmatimonadaceae bacterium]
DVPGADNVVVLSHRAWVSRHSSDPGIVGRAILVDGMPRTVIGVMPASFDLASDVEELWVPLALTRAYAAEHGARFLDFRARLGKDVSMQQAIASATQAIRATRESIPNGRADLAEYGAAIDLYIDDFVGDYKSLLLILLGAGSFVLLIACTNVANLLIARGSVRERELSIRAALGAGQRRLMRQLITESGVLALAGVVLGLALAFGLLRAVLAVSPEGVPRLEQARVNLPVLGFALLCAVLSTVLFGLVPALRLANTNLESALRAGGRALHGGRDRLRTVLVAVEVALAMTLLIGAGLLIRSAWLIQHVEPGFDPRGVLTSRILLPEARYRQSDAVLSFYDRLFREASEQPPFGSAALVSMVPLSGSNANSIVLREGQSLDDPNPLEANLRLASPRYFATMGIPIRWGRDIADGDDANAPRVVLVNEALARRLWPAESPREAIGRRISALSPKREQPQWWEVIGVVGDLHDHALDADVKPEFYVPVKQTPPMLWPYIQRSLVLVTRTRAAGAEAGTLERPIRDLVAGIDPNLPVADVTAMADYLRRSQATSRFNTLLLSTLGGIALLLAVIGVYGIVNYFVAQRTRDIAVRMALGATAVTIWRYVAVRGLQPLVVGIVVGAVLSLATARLLESRLYRVSATDPVTIAATAILLFLVAVVALYPPTRRAIRVQPVAALTP